MRPLIFVDVEATAPTPATGVMTEFGAVDFVTRSTLYARLWPFTPHPKNPVLPASQQGSDGSLEILPVEDLYDLEG